MSSPTLEKRGERRQAMGRLVKKLLIALAVATTIVWIIGLVRLLAPLLEG